MFFMLLCIRNRFVRRSLRAMSCRRRIFRKCNKKQEFDVGGEPEPETGAGGYPSASSFSSAISCGQRDSSGVSRISGMSSKRLSRAM